MAGELFKKDVDYDPDETLNLMFEVIAVNEGRLGVD
jgi:hypothetical protein